MERESPGFKGHEVLVHEPHRRPWKGWAIAEKWSKVSGWWIEVRDNDGMAWSVHEMHVSMDTLF